MQYETLPQHAFPVLTLASWIQVDVIYLDMSKAFDKVSHRKLLRKLRDYGFGGKLLAWLESYLHDRMQRVTAFRVNS